MDRYETYSERRERQDADALFEGVPRHLRDTLVAFVMHAANRFGADYFEGAILSLERRARLSGLTRGRQATLGERVEFNLETLNEVGLLKLVDECVRGGGQDRADQLNSALTQGGSAFEVREVDDVFGTKLFALERRVSEAVRSVEEQLPDKRVRDELAAARHDIYGQEPQPSEGLRHCVAAVEIAGLTVVLPADKEGTLGKLIGQLKAHPALHTTALKSREAPALTIAAMCDLLWETQRGDRHGTPEALARPPVTQAEAEMAYSLAVVLCEWFTKRHVTRLPAR